jgi:hypothetical protein
MPLNFSCSKVGTCGPGVIYKNNGSEGPDGAIAVHAESVKLKEA